MTLSAYTVRRLAMNYLLGGPCVTWAQTKAASPLLGAKYTWLVRPGSKYPPAEPGALGGEPLKAAIGGATRPQ
jgi:hypothetical protein